MALSLRGTCVNQKQLHPRLWKITILLYEMKHFHPGQYVGLTDLNEKRIGFFSIASVPANLPFIVLYTRAPLDCEDGQQLLLSAPTGPMVFEHSAIPVQYILCAGGTGITPFLSISKSFPLLPNWHLIWSIIEDSDRHMLDDMPLEIKKRFQIGIYPKENDRDLFESILQVKPKHHTMTVKYFLAGPMVFIEKVGAFLIAQGVDPKNIVSDLKKFIPLETRG